MPPELLRELDRAPEVLERVRLPAGEALAAGQVVEEQAVLRARLDDLAQPLRDLGVLTRLVAGPERSPELPAAGVVRLARRAADHEDRRSGLLRERRSLHSGTGEDERAGGRVDPLAVELEDRVPALDEVELLLPVVRLVVLVDDPVARRPGRPRRRAERGDPQVVPHGAVGLATVVQLLDLVQSCNRIVAHEIDRVRLSRSLG